MACQRSKDLACSFKKRIKAEVIFAKKQVLIVCCQKETQCVYRTKDEITSGPRDMNSEEKGSHRERKKLKR